MKNLFIIVLTVVFSLVGFTQEKNAKKSEAPVKEQSYFTCPMHSEVIQDKQGKCPKCGMDLVAAKNVSKGYCPMCKEKMTFKDGKCTKCGKAMMKCGDKEKCKEWTCKSCKHKNQKSGKCSKCGAELDKSK